MLTRGGKSRTDLPMLAVYTLSLWRSNITLCCFVTYLLAADNEAEDAEGDLSFQRPLQHVVFVHLRIATVGHCNRRRRCIEVSKVETDDDDSNQSSSHTGNQRLTTCTAWPGQDLRSFRLLEMHTGTENHIGTIAVFHHHGGISHRYSGTEGSFWNQR